MRSRWTAYAAVGATVLIARLAVAHTCGTSLPADCATRAGTTCVVACNETDFRDAVAVVNACGGNRRIRFDLGGCSAGCTVPMAHSSAVASCGNDSQGAFNAVCLTGSDITIDGALPSGVPGVRFTYVGPFPCASCAGSCSGPAPALFLVKGSRNTITHIQHRAFPEGVRINTQGGTPGHDSAIRSSLFAAYCEEAVTINAGARTTVEGNLFVGNADLPNRIAWKERTVFGSTTQKISCVDATDCRTFCSATGALCSASQPCPAGAGVCSAPNQQCHCPNGYFAGAGGNCSVATPGTCYRRALFGLDKAIQANGGQDSLITGNIFDRATRPIFVTDGNPFGGPVASATVAGNTVVGSTTSLALAADPTFTVSAQNVCTGVAASHESASNSVTALFTDNTIMSCKFGIESHAGATVTAVGNTVSDAYVSALRITGNGSLTGVGNRMRGRTPPSGSPNGSVLVESSTATVTFDGSSGRNVFCGTQTDVWNGQAGAPAVNATNNCHEGPQLDVVGAVSTAGSVPIGTPPCTASVASCNF